MKSRATACEARLRQNGLMILQYAGDFRGYYPTWEGDSADILSDPQQWPYYTDQAAALLGFDRWLQYTNQSRGSPSLRCPSSQPWLLGANFLVDYVGVAAMHADPMFLDPIAPKTSWKGKLGARAQRLDSVRFPADKAGLFEFYVWHGWRGSDVSKIPFEVSARPGNVWFVDGHVQGLAYEDALPAVDRRPIWNFVKLSLTESGVWGRDR